MTLSRRVVAAAAVTLAVLAGCTSQRGSGSNSPGQPANHLNGPPVKIGFVSMENTPLGSFPETRIAAESAVAYANAALGGVHGRPLELVPCATNGSPESSQDCANRLIAADPVAVIGGVDLSTEAAMPLYQQASIPYVSGSPQLSGELSSPNSFSLTGGTLTELLGITDYLTTTKHVTKVHALYADLPGLLTAAIQGSRSILQKKGVSEVRLVPEKVDTADFAPAVSQVASGNPDAIVVVFPAQSCARIAQVAGSLQVKAPIYFVGSCATAAVARAGGQATGNMNFASGYLPLDATGGDQDSRAFRENVPEASRSPLSQASFSTVLAARSLLTEITQTTPGDLRNAFRAARDHPNVMAHSFTCDGTLIKAFPAVCNTAVRILRWSDGGFVDATGTWVDGRELMTLIG
ncbi:ABC transporter substrate-binding protein [Protofrankia sp. BMG5.30]|uniref:Branched-chain amino acid ABC transporter substrate-binding protein n=1 Tax=Protofrankia coriariae TaxID=1562887 RepID=A0ABR5F460_9ACTN|nr:ABC transporter substrate-binding protein [Protofrankia sp. BMG5.30]KLL11418.1 branched-chain amino acid ABC transporter substrate-binding protein [Protofrankia coriariae]ONH34309.1 branched-chain amino acid ABC transporter substrate-binding protein [Protofrankia sp. BMG5.30]